MTSTIISQSTETSLGKFQNLLRKLFQFDNAELDFGIYRIMNHKRDAIEQFIETKLPTTVSDHLDSGPLAEQTRATQLLEKAAEAVRESLGSDAIDECGDLQEEFRKLPIGQDYLAAQVTAGRSQSRDAVEASIYNHLWTFFNRYYEEGDFISKRRYSRNKRYAIPFNGEEVYLHYANSDQYYVKTEEHFLNYQGKVPNGVTVRFRLQNANVAQNNVKGERRFFLPLINNMQWDGKTRSVTIPIEYRPLTGTEKSKFGTRKQQDKIITRASSDIMENPNLAADANAALAKEARSSNTGSVSYLEHHLRRYTARNNADFFIHKDLASFLNRELDFYLKHEVLNLDHMTAAGRDLADGWFQTLRLVKEVGNRIINFLAQIENFQRSLYEKRKFINETQYCITLKNIGAEFYPDIVANDKQWEEWCVLFAVDEKERTETFLQDNPTLVLDTKHFDNGFTDRLLAAFKDLEGETDGLLMHGDNWQVLNLIGEKYRGQVKCIYIDPPYNTAASEIIYKNRYRQSSWLSLITERLSLSLPILDTTGSWVVAIDDTEMVALSQLLDNKYTAYDRNMVVVNHHPGGSGLEGANISSTHEYAVFMTPVGHKTLCGARQKQDSSERGFMRSGQAESNLRSGRPNSFYAVLVDPAKSQVVGVEQPPSHDEYPTGDTDEGFHRIYPVSKDGTERVWRRSYNKVDNCIEKGEIICTKNKTVKIVTDQTGKRRPLFSNWTDSKYTAGIHGSNLLKDILGESGKFSYPKSIYTVRDCVDACTHDSRDAIVLDYFAGSGTTGHAVVNLNREDGGERKFILVEMGEYFDTVLLPRIKKLIFSPEWKDGQPIRKATDEEAEHSPRIVKYTRIESYEDALDSIEFDEDAGDALSQLMEPEDEYLLKYMLSWETKDSATLLNVSELNNPFDYRVRCHVNGTKQERKLDLLETFNYLLGLNVRTRQLHDDGGRRYLVFRGETRDAPGHIVVVIWRKTEGWSEHDFARDRNFVGKHGLAINADTVFVNGGSCIPDARPIEPTFKAKMFAGVGA